MENDSEAPLEEPTPTDDPAPVVATPSRGVGFQSTHDKIEYDDDREERSRRSSTETAVTQYTAAEQDEEYEKPEDLLPGQVYNEKDRPKWTGRFNSILCMLGVAVGLSNVYRFPYLCFTHGGPFFLMVYALFLVLLGVPLLYLEILVGQFCQSAVVRVWYKMVPILRGVGWTQVAIPYLLVIYSLAFQSWALHYAANGLYHRPTELPWIGCDNTWNTVHCRDIPVDFEEVDLKPGELRAGAEYFRGRVQRRWRSRYADPGDSHAIDDIFGNYTHGLTTEDQEGLGLPDLEMVIYLTIVFAILCLFIYKGIRLEGGFFLWSAICAPYAILVIIIFRSMAIPGAKGGLIRLFWFDKAFKDEAKHLGDVKLWVAAAQQVIFSIGIGGGTHLTFASYNHFHNNFYKDALAVVVIDTATSLIGSVMIFIALGSVAEADGSDLSELFAQGPDLIFEVCSDYWGRVSGADFFTFIFYVMVFLLGLETSVEAMIVFKEAMFEAFGAWFDRNGKTRWVFLNTLLAVAYGINLLCLSRGGLHLYLLLDYYSAGVPFLTSLLFMLVGFVWFWGLNELCDAAEAMTGKRPSLYQQISWKFVSPIVVCILLALQLNPNNNVKITDRDDDTRDFKKDALLFGKIYAHLPNIFIILGVLVHFCTRHEGVTCKQRLLMGISPNYTHGEILDTGTCPRAKLSHYFYCVNCSRKSRKITTKKVHPTTAPTEGGTTPETNDRKQGDLDLVDVDNTV